MGQGIKAAVARAVGALAIAALSVGFAAPSAFAEDGATKKTLTPEGSTCSNNLVKSGSGKARVSVSGYSYVDADISSAQLTTSQGAATVTSCTGTSDNGVTTSSITVTLKWVVTSTGLASCSFGFPSAVNCTVDGKEAIVTQSHTCKNTSKCTFDFDSNLRPKPRQGYKILNVTFEARAAAQQSGKSTVATETDAVTWWA